MDTAELQELIALVVVALVAGAVFGPGLYRRLTGRPRRGSGCSGCPTAAQDRSGTERPLRFTGRPTGRRSAG